MSITLDLRLDGQRLSGDFHRLHSSRSELFTAPKEIDYRSRTAAIVAAHQIVKSMIRIDLPDEFVFEGNIPISGPSTETIIGIARSFGYDIALEENLDDVVDAISVLDEQYDLPSIVSGIQAYTEMVRSA